MAELDTTRLEQFKKASSKMVAASDQAFDGSWSIGRKKDRIKNYSLEEVKKILTEGSLDEQLALSKNYFEKDGLYKRLLIYYATLLEYRGLIIPSPSFGKSLSTDHIKKKYFQAVDYVDKMNLSSILTEISLKVLVNGCYYGIIKKMDKNSFTIMALPTEYCITRFKTPEGVNLIEFNVTYFDKIVDKDAREQAFKCYPPEIVRAYKKYRNGKLKSKWVFVDPAIALCFQFFETPTPIFLNVIPSTIDYDNAVETEKERDLEEIRKIIIQKVPHLNDGTLLFEPEEAAVMHKGTVEMVKGNKNVSVLTTYTDVDAIVSKTSNDSATNSLQNMLKNVYSEAGTSLELFASSSNLTLSYSIKCGISLMMILGHKYEIFITSIINKLFSNSNISFRYMMLPISIYTEDDYADQAFKFAQQGYSLLMPAVAKGLSQNDICNIKNLETEVLKLQDLIKPREDNAETEDNTTGKVGRPTKDPSEKSPKTEANQKAIDNQNSGGTVNE